jgi:LysR family hydrogen peroxide-inducible transcriptional activator
MLGTVDSVARVLSGEFDLAIVVLPLNDTRLEVNALFREQVLVALPAGESRESMPLVDALARPDLLLSMRGLGLRAQVDEASTATNQPTASRVEMRSQRALLSMVAAGAGSAFVPAMSVAAGVAGTAAARLEPPLYREIGWVRRLGRHLPPAAFALLDGVKAAHDRLADGGGDY